MDGEIDPDELAALLDAAGAVDDEDAADAADDEDAADAADDEDAADAADDEDDELQIVDIRDQRAFDRGHIPDSVCVPFPELTTRVAELEGASRIVTVCPHGVASRQAAQLVGSYAGTADARVESLRGGIEAWERDIGELNVTSVKDTDGGADEGPEAPF